jgi:hypothetical protein
MGRDKKGSFQLVFENAEYSGGNAPDENKYSGRGWEDGMT